MGMTELDETGGREDGQELPESILATARQVNDPPATPREEIWARIKAERAQKVERADVIPLPLRPPARRPVLAWAVGIAAVLLVGIALGRGSVSNAPVPGPSTISALPDSTLPREKKNAAYTVAAVQHLTRVEAFLTTMRTAPNQRFNGQARELLMSTRLMLDAKDMDPRLHKLMADLEDILVQIVQYDASGAREDLDLITDGLEERQVLPRLHSAIPAGPARAL
jgi:hypothetical protein